MIMHDYGKATKHRAKSTKIFPCILPSQPRFFHTSYKAYEEIFRISCLAQNDFIFALMMVRHFNMRCRAHQEFGREGETFSPQFEILGIKLVLMPTVFNFLWWFRDWPTERGWALKWSTVLLYLSFFFLFRLTKVDWVSIALRFPLQFQVQ